MAEASLLADEPTTSSAHAQRKISPAFCSHQAVSTPKCHPKAAHQETLHRTITRVGRCWEMRLNHRIELRRNVFSPRGTANLPDERRFHTLASQRFQARLTLFPKYFASFPHGTCSLSVSRRYLALDGIHHPLRAALPSNPTLRHKSTTRSFPGLRGSHPLCRRVPTDLPQALSTRTRPIDYNSAQRAD